MKIIVIGKNGQVSRHLYTVLGSKATFLSRAELDLAQVNTVYPTLLATQANVIINAGAYTDTQRAESEPGLAYAINGAAVGEMARAAKDLDALLVHISTDYVFDGEKREPYTETDTPNPMSVYGDSKRQGEQLIEAIAPRYLILRTSWVFSAYRQNFVKTIAKLAKEREQLDIVADQTGCPTYAGHLAQVIGDILVRYHRQSETGKIPASGIYHYTDAPSCSWFEFAQAIVTTLQEIETVETAQPLATLKAIDSAAWSSPVRRPQNAVMSCERLYADWGITAFNWRDCLSSVLKAL